MTNKNITLTWEPSLRIKYDEMISKIPMFHRAIAKQVVDKKAIINAQERSSQIIEEGDVVRAFLTEVPMTFYSLMIRLFEDVGFDYRKYEKYG